LASPFAGYLADRFSRSRLITLSLAAWSISSGLAGFAITANQLLATRVLLGLSECLYLPAAVALIAHHHPIRTRATAMAIHVAGMSVGIIAGGFLSGYISERLGWRPMCFILGFGGLALAAATHFTLHDGPPRVSALGPLPRARLRDLPVLFRTPTFVVIILESMIVSVGTWIFSNWLPLFYHETFGLSLAGAGFSGTFMVESAGVLGMTLGGIYSDRVAARWPGRRMLLLSISYWLSAPCLLMFVFSRSYWLVSASLFLFALLRSAGTANEHPTVCDVLPEARRSTAVGLMNSANCFAGGLGVMAAGYFKSQIGLAGVMSSVSLLIVAAAVITQIGYRTYIRKDLAHAALRS
jgi:predicted MFS family arabinose efflux permease